MREDILKLVTFQSFFLMNNIGRFIISDNNDDEEIQFFFKIYQYIIFDLMNTLGIKDKKKINSCQEQITQREMYIIYNYMLDFIVAKKGLYESIKFD
ncbi:hypothetical protein Yalta_048 [Yalta virus]|nr:hypothetical protein Yalta_048 [Yalta virus]